MRNISNDILKLLEENAQYTYCFELQDNDGNDVHRLTSADFTISFKDKKYLPYSGLEIIFSRFDNSPSDLIKLRGFFDQRAIKRASNLLGYRVKIYIYFADSNKMAQLYEYICANMISYDLYFEIELKSNIEKFNKSAIEVYSIRCRANFGDKKCGLDKNKYHSNIYCDKYFNTCSTIFQNAINFRGEPFLRNDI